MSPRYSLSSLFFPYVREFALEPYQQADQERGPKPVEQVNLRCAVFHVIRVLFRERHNLDPRLFQNLQSKIEP